MDHGNNDFFDPLRTSDNNATVSKDDFQDHENTSSETSTQPPTKEWMSFKRFLMQRFPVSKMVSISSVSIWIISLGNFNFLVDTYMSCSFCWRPRTCQVFLSLAYLCFGGALMSISSILTLYSFHYKILVDYGFSDESYSIYYWPI